VRKSAVHGGWVVRKENGKEQDFHAARIMPRPAEDTLISPLSVYEREEDSIIELGSNAYLENGYFIIFEDVHDSDRARLGRIVDFDSDTDTNPTSVKLHLYDAVDPSQPVYQRVFLPLWSVDDGTALSST
jgi:hypothetical protein